MSDNEFPLYPNLSQEAQEEANQVLEEFKVKMKEISEETLSKLYCDTLMYIESDSWDNFRSELLDGFRNYNNKKIQASYDFKKIREEIYEQFKDDIIKDLNQDNLEEIENLKDKIKKLEEMNKELRDRFLY